jgi:hypothetical protein
MIQHSENMKLVKKIYIRPSLNKIILDSDLSLVMNSQDPPNDPGAGAPSGIGIMPGYLQKAFNLLIR